MSYARLGWTASVGCVHHLTRQGRRWQGEGEREAKGEGEAKGEAKEKAGGA